MLRHFFNAYKCHRKWIRVHLLTILICTGIIYLIKADDSDPLAQKVNLALFEMFIKVLLARCIFLLFKYEPAKTSSACSKMMRAALILVRLSIMSFQAFLILQYTTFVPDFEESKPKFLSFNGVVSWMIWAVKIFMTVTIPACMFYLLIFMIAILVAMTYQKSFLITLQISAFCLYVMVVIILSYPHSEILNQDYCDSYE